MTSDTENIGKRIFAGAIWTVAMRMSVRFLGIISIIILARLLDPKDFGLVAKALMIQSFLIMITEFGSESALIRDQNATHDDYDTVWTIHIIRGGFLGIILAALAYPAAKYFHEPRLELIMYYYAIATFLSNFYNIGIVDFRKNMIFSFDFRYNLYKKITGFITTITVALIWKTYWALVAGVMASTIMSLVTSFVMSPYRPRISLKKWRSLFHFSKWMLGFELINAISVKLDTFLISRYSTTANLGLYTISFEVSGTPSTEIAMPIARAALPGLAKLSHDIKQFSALYLSSLSLIMLMAVPAASGVSILANHITIVLLGVKWIGAAPLIQILAIFGITRAVYAIAVSALVAFNRPDLLTKISTTNMITRIIVLVTGISLYGLMGIVWGALISGILNIFVLLTIQERLGILSTWKLFTRIWRIIVAALIMCTGLYYLHEGGLIQNQPVIVQLLIEIFTGVFLYTVSLFSLWYVFSKKDGPEKSIVDMILKNKRKNL